MSFPAGSAMRPGDRYGYLTVLEVLGGGEVDRDPSRGRWARIRCDCGTRKMVRARHLGAIKSCGCKSRELMGQAKRRFWERWRAARLDLQNERKRRAG